MIKLELKTEGEEIKGSAELDRTNEREIAVAIKMLLNPFKSIDDKIAVLDVALAMSCTELAGKSEVYAMDGRMLEAIEKFKNEEEPQ